MNRFIVYTAIIFLFIGTILGGILFSDTQPRSVLSIHKCGNCLSANEFAGLLGSVITLKTPALIPRKILETDHTIVFKHPFPSYNTHYVLVPKKDIKDIGDLSSEDKEYIVDLYASAANIIAENNYHNYKFWSNGPGIQAVNYLHFHLGVN